jgi:hypothetical protein
MYIDENESTELYLVLSGLKVEDVDVDGSFHEISLGCCGSKDASVGYQSVYMDNDESELFLVANGSSIILNGKLEDRRSVGVSASRGVGSGGSSSVSCSTKLLGMSQGPREGLPKFGKSMWSPSHQPSSRTLIIRRTSPATKDSSPGSLDSYEFTARAVRIATQLNR